MNRHPQLPRGSVLRQRTLALLTSLHLLLPLRSLYNWGRYAFNVRVRRSNAQFLAEGSPDGLPIPSPFLIHEVSGVYDQRSFYNNGIEGAASIRRNLQKHDLAIEEFERILDFGCGCGRILRQWKTLASTEVHGTDYNSNLIAWCRDHLPFAQCRVNTLAPRLEYPEDYFDFIYAISVFTHLTEDLQPRWRDELFRVLKPGGYALYTIQGTHHRHKLTEVQQEQFRLGKLVVQQEEYPGMNTCQVFHPESYARELFSMGGTIIDFVPGGAPDAGGQDVLVIRKT